MDTLPNTELGLATHAEIRDHLADFAAHQTREARVHFLRHLVTLLDASNASWIVALRMSDPCSRDPLKGWRPRMVQRLHEDAETAAFLKAKTEQMNSGKGEIDVVTTRRVADAGTFRVHRLCDLAPEGWYDGAFYKETYLARGQRDSLWGAIPLNDDLEIYVGLFRALDQADFSAADAALFADALKGMKWFHRQQVLGEGIGVVSSPLTASERLVLNGLLQGHGEQVIAHELGKSQHTIHDRVKSIFRKYGVRSRPALMALWLGQGLQRGALDTD